MSKEVAGRLWSFHCTYYINSLWEFLAKQKELLCHASYTSTVWARGHPIQPFAKPNNVHRATLQEIIS